MRSLLDQIRTFFTKQKKKVHIQENPDELYGQLLPELVDLCNDIRKKVPKIACYSDAKTPFSSLSKTQQLRRTYLTETFSNAYNIKSLIAVSSYEKLVSHYPDRGVWGTSIIKSVVRKPLSKIDESRRVQLCDYELTMEDGTKGCTKAEWAYTFDVLSSGDRLEYTKFDDKYGVKLRIKKVNSGAEKNNYSQKYSEFSHLIDDYYQIIQDWSDVDRVLGNSFYKMEKELFDGESSIEILYDKLNILDKNGYFNHANLENKTCPLYDFIVDFIYLIKKSEWEFILRLLRKEFESSEPNFNWDFIFKPVFGGYNNHKGLEVNGRILTQIEELQFYSLSVPGAFVFFNDILRCENTLAH